MRFLPDLKKLVNVEEKSASPVHNPANKPDPSGLPYTPSAIVYRPASCKCYISTSSVPEPLDQGCHIRLTKPSATPPRDDAFMTSLQLYTTSVFEKLVDVVTE